MFKITTISKEHCENTHIRETWQGVLNLFGEKDLSNKYIAITEEPSGQKTIKDYGYPDLVRNESLIRWED